MVALCNRADHYIFALLFLSSIFYLSTPWGDVVIYLKPHPNWSKGLGGGGVQNFAYPIDFTIGF